MIGAITPQLIDKDEPDRVMIIDRIGGGEGSAIEQRFKLDQDHKVLTDLSRYVQRHHLEKADPAALWSQHDRWYGDADIRRFIAEGGVAVGQGENRRVKAKDTPSSKRPKPDYEVVPVPASLQGVPGGTARRRAEADPQARRTRMPSRSIMSSSSPRASAKARWRAFGPIGSRRRSSSRRSRMC